MKKERLVTISSRTIYHKYATISIAIPNDIKKENVGEWLFENEGKWVDDLEQANGEASLDFGFGLGYGMDEKESELEVRYDIEGENYGGHI
tara:strand:+ start:450 stop:722 length:273 start_codon:yes stop_codon:yes gene_type:complete